MANDSALCSLLNDIEIESDPPIGDIRCSRFSLDVLSLIRHKLPPVAIQALEVLKSYLSGRGQLSSVTASLAGLWKYLDEFHKEQDVNIPEVAAIRAVIFPLDAQKHPEEKNIVDHLALFLTFVNSIEPHYEDEERLLRKHFSALGA